MNYSDLSSKLTQVIEQIPKDALYDFCCSYAQEHEVTIKVKVPEGLKWWYYGLYYASLVASVFLSISIILLILADVKLLQPYSVAGVYALFAAMITTRGWLMHDAHVFNKLSILYTVISFTMLFEAIVYTVLKG